MNEEKKKFIQQMWETMEQQIPTVIQRRKEPGQEEKDIQAINMNSMRVNVEEQYGVPEGIPLAPVLAPLIRTQMMIAGFPYTVMLDSGASASVVPRWFVLEIIGKFGKDWVQKRLRPSFTMLRGIANGTLKARYELILCVDTGSTVVAIPFVIDEAVENVMSAIPSIIVGKNAMEALGFVILSPSVEILMSPTYHQLPYKVFSAATDELIYDG
ncbi:MAG: hypothetical protein GY795_31180 [Desulfobacterales bacterium]|nr:hypothetical protein [Desulfobacterales bacterium]